MSNYIGNFTQAETVTFKFNTRDVAGVPTTLLGTPTFVVYKNNSIVKSTLGITATINVDGVVGNNALSLSLADAFYASGDFTVQILTGTVSGVSVVGEILTSFSVNNRFYTVDVTKINASATAALNLKNNFDGVTGLTGNTFPATQAQVTPAAGVEPLAPPAHTATQQAKIDYIFAALVNKTTFTAASGVRLLRNAADTLPIATATDTDVAGVTTRGKSA